MPYKSEIRFRKKLETIRRHKQVLDALGTFVRAHRRLAEEYDIHPLHGKLGLKFGDYALIVPRWQKDKLLLRLVKSGDDWLNSVGGDDYYSMAKTVKEDVSRNTTKQLENMLDRLFKEANPDWAGGPLKPGVDLSGLE